MEGFERLYSENKKYIYYYLYKMCRQKELAEDLVQEAFYRALVHICGKNNVSITRSWLVKVAHNVFIDYLRKNKAKCDDFEKQEYRLKATPVNKDMRINIQDALAGLPLRYRSIILLKDHYGYTYEEISEIIGCSLSTVKVTLHRARKRFREAYD